MANKLVLKIAALSVLLSLLIGHAEAQFDAALIVSALSTGFSLIKYIINLWGIVSQERQDGGHPFPGLGSGGGFHVPGPIPDLDVDFYQLANLSWALRNSSLNDIYFNWLHTDRAILAQFSAISVKLSGLDLKISVIEQSLARLANQLPSLIQWELGLDRLLATMRPIHSLYDTFRLYQQQRDNIEKLTLEDFATTLVSHGTDSVRSLLWQLHDLAVPIPYSVRIQTRTDSESQGDFIKDQIPKMKGNRPARKKRRQFNLGIFQQFQDYFGVSECNFSTFC